MAYVCLVVITACSFHASLDSSMSMLSMLNFKHMLKVFVLPGLQPYMSSHLIMLLWLIHTLVKSFEMTTAWCWKYVPSRVADHQSYAERLLVVIGQKMAMIF